jgi:hypothetical protein
MKAWIDAFEINKYQLMGDKIQPLGEIENQRSRDDQQDKETLETQTVIYIDSALAKKNSELHSLLKSVPTSDYVIDTFSAAIQKEILAQGTLYLTQNRICFYSNIMGFINNVKID